jgi:hypothetical protein
MQFLAKVNRFQTVAGLADHLPAGVLFQEASDPTPHYLVVIGNKDAERCHPLPRPESKICGTVFHP